LETRKKLKGNRETLAQNGVWLGTGENKALRESNTRKIQNPNGAQATNGKEKPWGEEKFELSGHCSEKLFKNSATKRVLKKQCRADAFIKRGKNGQN